MALMNKNNWTKLSVFILSIVLISSSNAHMMLAQHGTLNVVSGGAFMVLSLPVSAFKGVDDDNDGKLSMDEFDTHRLVISKVIKQQVVLSDEQGKCPLQGMILSPVTAHNSFNAPVSQLIVMGRFKLNEGYRQLHYQIELFGEKDSEQKFEITATRKADGVKRSFEIEERSPLITIF